MSVKQHIQIARMALADLIDQYHGGHFFSVCFIKRTTGEVRKMTCRKDVSAYVTGTGLKYDRAEKRLIGVWSADVPEGGAKAYRNIPMEGLISAVIAVKVK